MKIDKKMPYISGEELAQARAVLRLSQNDLGNLTGNSREAVNKWEKLDRVPGAVAQLVWHWLDDNNLVQIAFSRLDKNLDI